MITIDNNIFQILEVIIEEILDQEINKEMGEIIE